MDGSWTSMMHARWHQRPGTRTTAWGTSWLRPLKAINYHLFKSWWAWILVGASGTETRGIGCVSFLLYKHKKRYLTVYSLHWPPTQQKGAMQSAQAMREVGGLWGAQAVRDVRTGHKSWVKSWWAWDLVSKVGLNFYTLLDKARWKETRLYGANLAFGSLWDALLWAHLPFNWNERCTYITRISHTRKRDTCVLGASLPLGPHALKFQTSRSLLSHLAIF
jgi:hypothetical protein